jgi:hypothetical protein
VPAFSKVLQLLNVATVPQPLLQLFIPFIASYQVLLDHDDLSLKQIFVLAKRINGSLEWLKQTEHPHVVVAEDGPDFEKHFSFPDIVALFLAHSSLYSWPYLSLMTS